MVKGNESKGASSMKTNECDSVVQLPRQVAMQSMTLELVTPAKAAEYLAHNTLNRKILPKRVRGYREQMKRGHWPLTHQGIAFDWNGVLRDGQHRLQAIIDADTAMYQWVCRGIDPQAACVLDSGKPRSLRDRIRIAGFEMDRRGAAIANTLWSVYKSQELGMESWPTDSCIDTEQFLRFAKFHASAIEFVVSRDPKRKGISHGVLLSAICAAYYTENRGRLAEFQSQLVSGEVTSKNDNAVLRLRDWVLTKDTSGGYSARYDLWLRSCTALRAYCSQQPVSRLTAAVSSSYPLPKVRGIKLD
jgi:hypothetical protein